MSITIRPARPGDEQLVVEFIRALARYERLETEVEATPQAITEALFSASPKVFCDIGEADGGPAGFALWYYTFSTFRGLYGIYLEDLYVREDLRGQGLGKAFLRRLAARCVAEGLGRLEWSVLDWNQPAIAFYKAHGARLLDDWTQCRVEGDALASLAAAGDAEGKARWAV